MIHVVLLVEEKMVCGMRSSLFLSITSILLERNTTVHSTFKFYVYVCSMLCLKRNKRPVEGFHLLFLLLCFVVDIYSHTLGLRSMLVEEDDKM